MKSERRKFNRYIAKNDGFHIFSHGSEIIGKLIDISKSGLAYQYNSIEGKKLEANLIHIMWAGLHRFYLFNVICKTIYDIRNPAEIQSLTGADTRRRGLQYDKLTENQQDKLELLLKNYVVQSSDNSG